MRYPRPRSALLLCLLAAACQDDSTAPPGDTPCAPASLPAAPPCDFDSEPLSCAPAGPLREEKKLGAYVVRIYDYAEDLTRPGFLEIQKESRRLYGRTGHKFYLGSPVEE